MVRVVCTYSSMAAHGSPHQFLTRVLWYRTTVENVVHRTTRDGCSESFCDVATGTRIARRVANKVHPPRGNGPAFGSVLFLSLSSVGFRAGVCLSRLCLRLPTMQRPKNVFFCHYGHTGMAIIFTSKPCQCNTGTRTRVQVDVACQCCPSWCHTAHLGRRESQKPFHGIPGQSELTQYRYSISILIY